MNSFKRFAQNGALYTLLILTAFYLFAEIADFSEKGIHLGKFLTVAGFGFAISASGMIFGTKIHKALKYAINYAVLCVAFCVIFINASTSATNPVAKFFIAIVVFSLVYGIAIFFRYIFSKRTK